MKANNNIAIKLINVSKKYTIHHEKPTLVEEFVKSIKSSKYEDFYALKHINLTIKKGEYIGLFGPNGSGKTTLLKLIAGISVPTDGEIIVNGKVTSLIDLEAGFHPDLTGYQNIYLNAMILGLRKKEIDRKINDIINFADIKQFIDVPLFSYSQGMKLRLGFSVAINTDADIIIMDEGFAVGDKLFIKKAINKVNELVKKGITIILVTPQDIEFLEKNCSIVLTMNAGKITKKMSK